jgi:hypothetical protein
MSNRSLVVSLHDVSPHTHRQCEAILSDLAALGVSQCSLLVVPDHHARGHFLEDAPFCAWLRELAQAGHEIVIHGYFHQRTRREDESLAQRLTTRVYTADEGEFYDLDRSTATALVEKARGEFAAANLSPTGFIAPAWLLSDEAAAALRSCGLSYTTLLGSVVDLQTGIRHKSQSLVWSVRSRWRRVTSLAWNGLLFRALARRPLLRISVHPVDIEHRRIWRQITRLIARALEDRQPLTYERWLAMQFPRPAAPATSRAH